MSDKPQPMRTAVDIMGMTLRDWFAGQALAGLLAQASLGFDAAQAAYEYADEMLAERSATLHKEDK